jgi:hypothetical protein
MATTRTKSAPKQPNTIDLDRLYPVEDIAPWMGLSARTVLELARRNKIPVVRYNDRVLRFHPRTILLNGGQKAA